jgi:4-amino-4-deoxy-L-arabinose transferase-like glycosyltransferase
MKNKNLPLLLFLFLMIWEISNPGALRQGTEGFYLKIAQEMFQTQNYLTPTYLNEPHWSKPPLHFWLPQITSLIGLKFNLLTARLSILFFSFGCIYYLSKTLHRLTLKPLYLYFTALITSFAYIKYSRIYMMEAPLSLLCATAIICFYDFFENNKRTSFYVSCICAGLSCLIKGPVSLMMIFMASGTYFLFNFSYANLKKFSFFVFVTLALSSPWFFLSLLKYGKDFYYYFFIRENLGKFTSKTYPTSSVFLGFLVYAMPLTFFLPSLLKNYRKVLSDKFLFFCLICFISFFIIWLFPKQRSYHYAIPCIPFYIILVIQTPISLKFFKVINFILIGICLCLVVLSSYFFSHQVSILRTLFAIALFGLAFNFIKKGSLTSHLFSCAITILTILNIYLPSFYRPVLPEKVVRYFDNREAPTVIIKHPYYVENLINKSVTVIDIRELAPSISKGPAIFITSRSHFNTIKDSVKELAHWAVWRRGLRTGEIFQALIQKSTSSLEEDYVLFTNDEKYFADQI